MLFLGAYGRISGNLPATSPYARRHPADEPEALPSTAEEFAAEAAMREAEIAVVQHYASPDQRQRVQLMSGVRTRAERRSVWLQHDASR